MRDKVKISSSNKFRVIIFHFPKFHCPQSCLLLWRLLRMVSVCLGQWQWRGLTSAKLFQYVVNMGFLVQTHSDTLNYSAAFSGSVRWPRLDNLVCAHNRSFMLSLSVWAGSPLNICSLLKSISNCDWIVCSHSQYICDYKDHNGTDKPKPKYLFSWLWGRSSGEGCSLSPMFPQPYVPSALCSLCPMFPLPYVPSALCSLCPIFHQPYVTLYHILPQPYVPSAPNPKPYP